MLGAAMAAASAAANNTANALPRYCMAIMITHTDTHTTDVVLGFSDECAFTATNDDDDGTFAGWLAYPSQQQQRQQFVAALWLLRNAFTQASCVLYTYT